MTLYTIDKRIGAILDRTAETDGELTPEIEAELTAVEVEWVEKVDAILTYARQKDLNAASLKSEEERLYALRKSEESESKRLKRYVADSLISRDEREVQTAHFKAYLQNNPPSVVVGETVTVFDLPEQFRRVREPEIDKKALLEAHKAGQTLPAGVTVEQGQSLRVK